MRKIILGIFFAIIFLINPGLVKAENEFATNYDVTYDIGIDGMAQITQKITLTNLTSRFYASNFTLSIGSTDVSDVLASDDSGYMPVKVENKDNKTSITVTFNQQVAGLEKSQTFTLKFKSKDFAENLGKTWEVSLPKIPDAANLKDYNLVLSVPVSFGDPTSISPNPKSESQTYDRLFFTFGKEELKKSGVSVNFGTNQIFDYTLRYHLENNSLFPVLTSIALPPDTAFQDVLVSRIIPEPINVTKDDDGNYLAWYRLPRRFKQEIIVSGSTKLYIKSKIKQPQPLSSDQIYEWTKSDHFWEKDNPSIKAALAEIYKDGIPKNSHEKAYLIHQYVVKTLKYDTARVNNPEIDRLGAVTVLNNPDSAICMEFTDLFIALTRAAGIPAREMDGFAYTQNKKLRPLSLSRDLLHAWPEYFDDQKGWIMVDPTWENTSGGVDFFNKFDLNHMALAVKGVSSQIPPVSDDVKVTVSNTDFLAKPQPEIEIISPGQIWAGFPSSLTVKVTNRGNAVMSSQILSINSSQIKVQGQDSVALSAIPPFGSATYKFNLKTPFVWQSFKEPVTIQLGTLKLDKEITIVPLFLFSPFPQIFFALIFLIVSTYLAILGFHIYKKRVRKKRKNDPKLS